MKIYTLPTTANTIMLVFPLPSILILIYKWRIYTGSEDFSPQIVTDIVLKQKWTVGPIYKVVNDPSESIVRVGTDAHVDIAGL